MIFIACLFLPFIYGFQLTHQPSLFCVTSKKIKHTSLIAGTHISYLQSSNNNMNQSRDIDTSNQPTNKKMKSSTTAVESCSSTNATTPSNKGTIYITIGPQCAGKTTILKRIFGQSFDKNEEDIVSSAGKSIRKEEGGVDITIDDQKLVYIPVAASYFLYNNTSSNTNNNNNNSSNASSFPSLNSTVYGKTIRERINDPSNVELALLTQRLGGTLTAQEFASRIQQQQGKDNGRSIGSSNLQTTVQEDLIHAVEHVLQLHDSKCGGANNEASSDPSPLLPEKIDLFIVESIFQPRPMKLIQISSNKPTRLESSLSLSSSETVSALDQSLHQLKSYATDHNVHSSTAPLSSGNTNTRPREFQNALEAAKVSGRPVEFIVFGGNEACEMICQHVSRREYRKMPHEHNEEDDDVDAKDSTKDSPALLCLPKVDRRTLFIRNINRFIQTGRYIPTQAIDDAMVRVESMLANAVAEANKRVSNEECAKTTSMDDAKFLLDSELAKLAGYRLNTSRTVSGGNANNNNNGGRRYDSSRGNNNRNNYQSGRGGNNRYQHRPGGRYDGGRGRNHNESRGRNNGGRGYSNSYSGNSWNSSGRQEHPSNRSYNNNSGRGYGQHRGEWGRR